MLLNFDNTIFIWIQEVNDNTITVLVITIIITLVYQNNNSINNYMYYYLIENNKIKTRVILNTAEDDRGFY